MDYHRFGDTCYVRLDRGDEVISSLLAVAEKEHIASATYTGIGGCGKAEIQTFLPETGDFEVEVLEGMLELVSLTGNIVSDEKGTRYHHTHAMFAYKEDGRHKVSGGHIRSITVRYTAEIELCPTIGGTIRRRYDEETGTGFWDFAEK